MVKDIDCILRKVLSINTLPESDFSYEDFKLRKLERMFSLLVYSGQHEILSAETRGKEGAGISIHFCTHLAGCD